MKANMFSDRSFWLPEGAVEIKADDSSAVSYLAVRENGKAHLMGFSGKRNKPDFNYLLKNEAAARAYAAEHAVRVKDAEARRAASKAARYDVDASKHYKVGDILHTSWGWEQTNVEFFKIIRVLPKAIEVVAIGAHLAEATGPMQGRFVPDPDHEIREGYAAKNNGIKRVIGSVGGSVHVNIHEHSGGYPTDPEKGAWCSWYA